MKKDSSDMIKMGTLVGKNTWFQLLSCLNQTGWELLGQMPLSLQPLHIKLESLPIISQFC
jgi:hypothetical protein